MNQKEKIKQAIAEAERFLSKAKLVKFLLGDSDYLIVGRKETGAMYRSSMDLTRALADLRRPN